MSIFIDTRSIDDLGRAVIPKALRNKYDIAEGDEIEFSEEDGNIVIRRAKPCCVICKSLENLISIEEEKSSICAICVEKIKNMPVTV